MRPSFSGKILAAGVVAGLVATAGPSIAAKYDKGADDKSIRIGNIVPYSGNVSAYGAVGTCIQAYFEMVNDKGGINGRKVEVISLDDGYNPARTVQQARRLVEREDVLLMSQNIGTPTNSAIHEYVNKKNFPHLLITTGASKWNNPEQYPWTMSFLPSYATEGIIYARYVLANIKDAKIGILYQNDDFGRDYLDGFREGLGDKADQLIVEALTFEATDSTIDAQITQLKASGANVFFSITSPRASAQSIRRAHEIGWKPTFFIVNVSNGIDSVLKPAGFDASEGLISAQYLKDASNPAWKDHDDMKAWFAWREKYNPKATLGDWWNTQCFSSAATLEHILEKAGDDLTHENIMVQAASLKGFVPPLLLPGIGITTSETDHGVIEQLQLMRFTEGKWELFGEIIDGAK